MTRLVGLAAVASLIATPLVVAVPANAVDPGNGVISVKVVDDLGRPVVGSVALVPLGDEDTPLTLGQSAPDEPPTVASSYTQEVPTGTYGAMAIGGWAGLSCVGLATCSVSSVMGGIGGPISLGAGAFAITEGATTPVTIRVATPKLSGSPAVGQPLRVTVPSSLTELGVLIGGIVGGGGLGLGMSTEPTVTWNRNGAPLGAVGPTYTPTAADAGRSISATVTFPPLLALYFGSMAPGVVPAAFTTKAVAIKKLTPRIRLSVPGKVKQGQRPKVYVNVKVGQNPVGGVVTFAVDKMRPQQAVLRSGLATFKLPNLKPGKHKVKASFAAAGAYNGAKLTKTIVVKKATRR